MNSKKIFTSLLFAICCAAHSADTNEIVVISGSQDSEGVTQEQFNIETLRSLENHTKTRVKKEAEEYLISQGYKNPKVEFQSSAVYVNVQQMKLAVVRLSDKQTNQVHIFGIRGGELVRVACVRQTIETIPLSYGKCADKLKETYGVDMTKGLK